MIFKIFVNLLFLLKFFLLIKQNLCLFNLIKFCNKIQQKFFLKRFCFSKNSIKFLIFFLNTRILNNLSFFFLEILFYLREFFENVDCKLELSPNVSIFPYNLNVTHIGQQIYIVPDIVPIDEAARLLISGKVITTVDVNFFLLF